MDNICFLHFTKKVGTSQLGSYAIVDGTMNSVLSFGTEVYDLNNALYEFNVKLIYSDISPETSFTLLENSGVIVNGSTTFLPIGECLGLHVFDAMAVRNVIYLFNATDKNNTGGITDANAMARFCSYCKNKGCSGIAVLDEVIKRTFDYVTWSAVNTEHKCVDLAAYTPMYGVVKIFLPYSRIYKSHGMELREPISRFDAFTMLVLLALRNGFTMKLNDTFDTNVIKLTEGTGSSDAVTAERLNEILSVCSR